MQEVIFYNGFNLLVDIVLCSIVGFLSYRAGKISGYFKGYSDGENDYKDRAEQEAEYYYNSMREDSWS